MDNSNLKEKTLRKTLSNGYLKKAAMSEASK